MLVMKAAPSLSAFGWCRAQTG